MAVKHPFEDESVEYESPKVMHISQESIEKFSSLVSDSIEFTSGGDLKKVVSMLGGKIHYLDSFEYENTDSGSILVHGVNDFDICLPNFTSPLRDRFTIGHELGHYFLHSRQGEIPLKAQRLGNSPEEKQAHSFAGAFLMSKESLTKDRKVIQDVGILAGKYKVSFHAMQVRLSILNLP